MRFLIVKKVVVEAGDAREAMRRLVRYEMGDRLMEAAHPWDGPVRVLDVDCDVADEAFLAGEEEKMRAEKFRVKYIHIERRESFVTDGDQDGDAWEGTKKEAEKMIRAFKDDSRARPAANVTEKYAIVPVKDA